MQLQFLGSASPAQPTASATPNAPGAWLQLFASTAVAATDAVLMIQMATNVVSPVSGTDNSVLLDIGRGAAGSEVIVAQDIAVGGQVNNGLGSVILLPVRLNGATRIAVRVRAATASRVFRIDNSVLCGAATSTGLQDRLPLTVDTLGTNTATSSGTAMSGSSGMWVEITPATTRDYQSLLLVPSGPGIAGAVTLTTFRLDLGLGAAGSEQAVGFVNAQYNTSSFISVANVNQQHFALYHGHVPAGTRIAVRHNLAANPERVTTCVIGVPYA